MTKYIVLVAIVLLGGYMAMQVSGTIYKHQQRRAAEIKAIKDRLDSLEKRPKLTGARVADYYKDGKP